jgi:pyruvate,water dikinase
LNVTNREKLRQAIARCQASYDKPAAVQYRRDLKLKEDAIAVLIQTQVRGVFSGVAFSRDPISQQGDVVIEALPGDATQVVSGRVTPEQYRVSLANTQFTPSWALPELELEIKGRDVPAALIQQVAFLARH